MVEIILALEMTLAQISGAYLRYLPFSGEISEKQLSALKKWIILWSFVDFGLNLLIFSDGLSYQTYKIALLGCWLPYFLISAKIIEKKSVGKLFGARKIDKCGANIGGNEIYLAAS